MSGRRSRRARRTLKETMNRISEGSHEEEEEEAETPKTDARKSSSSLQSSSSSSEEVPHIWKEHGSSADNVARRTAHNTRSVTFSPEEPTFGKRLSYFSVQKPWVQRTFEEDDDKEPSSSPFDENVDSIYTTDESILERSRSTEISMCETTTSQKTVITTVEEEAASEPPVESPKPSKGEDQVLLEECRNDDEESLDDRHNHNIATELKFKKGMEDQTPIEEWHSSPLLVSPLNDNSELSITKNLSPNRRMSFVTGDVYQPPTDLHDVCYNAQLPSDLLAFQASVPLDSSSGRKQLKQVAQDARARDYKGRTPLHLISQNHAISSILFPDDDDSVFGLHHSLSNMSDASEKKQVTDFILDVLLAANPNSMKLQDVNGHVPFERGLIEWIHIMHNVESPKSKAWGLGSRRFSSYSRMSAPSKISHMWQSTTNQVSAWAGKSFPFTSASARSMGTMENSSPKKTDDIENGIGIGSDGGPIGISEEEELPDDTSWALDHFPSHVQLTSHVKFCITLLSTILDHLDDYVPSRSFRRRSQMDRRSNGSNQTRDSFDVAMDEFRDYCFTESAETIALDIVQEIAAIPYLVKTMLLIEDEEEREWVFSTTLFQRVILSESSIGPWLTGMLQSSKKGVSHRALQYLVSLSDVIEDNPHGWGPPSTRKSSSNLSRDPIDAHEELHQKVGELDGFITSLLALEERKIEEAATTLVVRKVLDRMISKPFAVSIVLLDSIFLGLLIISFRAACKVFLTGGNNTALYWIYLANSCTFYFIIRELGKGITILERTKRARTYFLSFWTITDILSICLALSSTVAMRVQFKQETINYDDITALRGLLATSTGLLWLRVLSLLKSINSQLATFVLAIFQISRDILWFLVILSVLVVAFAQMFYTILIPSQCASNGSGLDATVCGSAEYYLKTYTILLGDFGGFERDDFPTAFSLILICIFSFMVVIVLLNVLIAIVSDSYEKCLIRSQSLFGRARVLLIAELFSFESLLRTSSNRNDQDPPASIYSKWWYGTFGNHGWSRATTIFFALSGIVVITWFVAETAGYFTGKKVGNYVYSLISIFVNVILFIVIVRLLSNNANNEADGSRRVLNRNGRCGCIWKWYDDTVQKAMLRLLGSDRENKPTILSRKKRGGDPDEEWSGRVHYLQREMMRLAEETATAASENHKAMEQSIRESEERMEAMMKESINQLLEALSANGNKLD